MEYQVWRVPGTALPQCEIFDVRQDAQKQLRRINLRIV
jgi:hypothetical protein